MTGFRFKDYVWEFHGYHGLRPMGASREVMDKACRKIMGSDGYKGDGVDRERVCKVLEDWGYGSPKLTPDVIAIWLKQIVVDQCAKDPEDRDWYVEIGRVIDRLEGYNGS